jgi:hypothetical protein
MVEVQNQESLAPASSTPLLKRVNDFELTTTYLTNLLVKYQERGLSLASFGTLKNRISISHALELGRAFWPSSFRNCTQIRPQEKGVLISPVFG